MPLRFLLGLLWLTATSVQADTPLRGTFAFTTPEGSAAEVFTLTNSPGLRARVLTWGATLIEMSVPDRAGKFADVTLGFDELERYAQPHPFFGSIAGRYANRIAKARFALDGRTYSLAANNGSNHLHGGQRGFDKRIWKAEPRSASEVRFSYASADGEEGYPGTLATAVTYTLTEQNELRIAYEATTDRPTVVNLTNHTYWNLAGRGDILAHELQLHASRVTVVDSDLIPTGELRAVAGTALDFSKPKPVGRDLAELKGEGKPGGYDHNFVIDATKPGEPVLAAELHDPASGRTMRVMTTEPAVQLYTANGLNNVAGKGGATYGPHAGLCLETQHFPDSPNHPDFPSTVLRPGETLRSLTAYAFSTR
ncbi:MAG: aldose 1-epimerase [Chthoniobacter sp.]|jgi:aldose 1-epimerase|nr:aldose 1-epimerase [Chthoniobacter sp.]